jgi:hypothetical protein
MVYFTTFPELYMPHFIEKMETLKWESRGRG